MMAEGSMGSRLRWLREQVMAYSRDPYGESLLQL